MSENQQSEPGESFSSGDPRPHKSLCPRVFGYAGAGLALLLIAALFLPANRGTREAGRRTQCLNNLRSLAFAITNYASDHGRVLPPAYIADAAGRPMRSWRVLILPYLDQRELYNRYRFDEPWDGPNNRKLHDAFLEVFCCPADDGGPKSTHTSYVAVVGPETAWPGKDSATFDQIAAADGLSDTLLLVEVADSGIHWMEPRDLDFAAMRLRINDKSAKGIVSRHPGIANGAFADGRAKPFAESLEPELLRALLTRNGGETIDDEF